MGHPKQLGYWSGLVLGAVALLTLVAGVGQQFITPGPANTGHADVACVSCHLEAPGTPRQQIQANAGYWLGDRPEQADFGYLGIESDVCERCHVNADDRHPIYRFNEPRFAEVREAVAPHRCSSCHQEHLGVRTSADPGICVHCHEELKMDDDPLDVSHETLVNTERWETCLGCHDYHGNHAYIVATEVSEAFTAEQVESYADGGDSPYGDRTIVAVEPAEPNQ